MVSTHRPPAPTNTPNPNQKVRQWNKIDTKLIILRFGGIVFHSMNVCECAQIYINSYEARIYTPHIWKIVKHYSQRALTISHTILDGQKRYTHTHTLSLAHKISINFRLLLWNQPTTNLRFYFTDHALFYFY